MTKELSSSTLSNIERGFSGVTIDKIEAYCNVLEVSIDQLPSMIYEENIWHTQSEQKLTRIEHMIDLIGANQAHKQLKNIELPLGDPLEVIYRYLEARCYYHKGKYAKASNGFTKTIKLIEKHPFMEYTNILSACYKELGRIYFYYHNNLTLALQHTETGLQVYNENGERKIIKYALLSCKASYLEKMQQDEEALATIRELWSEKDQWYRSNEVVLNILEIQANLYAKKEFYDEAMTYALDGLEIARANKNLPRALELITTLGNICTMKKAFDEAEEWYLFALKFKKVIKKEYLFVSTYTQLGILYMEINSWEKAEKYLELAIDLGANSADRVRHYFALMAFGDYFVKTNQSEQAIYYYEEAANQAENHQFSFIDPNLYAKLSHCLQKIDPVKSQKYMDKYIKMTLKLDLNPSMEVD